MTNHGFSVPKNKYSLDNAEYSIFDHIMISYRGVQYHLKEQSLAGLKPENTK